MADGASTSSRAAPTGGVKRKRGPSGLLGRLQARSARPFADFQLETEEAAWPSFAQPHVTHCEKKHALDVTCLDLDAQLGRFLLSGGINGDIHLYDLFHGDEEVSKDTVRPAVGSIRRPHAHKYSLTSVAWYPADRGIFASSSYDATVKVWDTEALSAAAIIDLNARIHFASFGILPVNHDLIAAACEDHVIRICDLRTGGASHTLTGHTQSVACVQWSPLQEHVLVSCGNDATIRLWDIRRAGTSAMLGFFGEHDAQGSSRRKAHVRGMTFTPDGEELLSIESSSRMELYNFKTRENQHVYYPAVSTTCRLPAIMPVPVDAEGTTSSSAVFTPDENGLVVFNLKEGHKEMHIKHIGAHVTSIATSPLEQMVVAGTTTGDILCFEPGLYHQDGGEENEIDDVDAWSSDEE